MVDGRGKFLIPGLWDMHSHITHTNVDFPVYLANGVLGIRNMGGIQEEGFRWQAKLKDGSLLGPLVYVSGPILDSPDGPVMHGPKSYLLHDQTANEGMAADRASPSSSLWLPQGANFGVCLERTDIAIKRCGHRAAG